MKTKSFFLFLLVCVCATLRAQEFYGYVKKADSTSLPIFQAKIDIAEGDKAFKTLKTYFDGSFKFTPNKNQTYLIKISYSGYTDTAYTITTDKNAKASVQNITVKLKKDGMRLMGMIKSREEDFPIKGATIVVRNVMTRKEERITTDIDGKYNFKLEYETNYKVWIDKRSTGIFNVYKDTSFYISTIGFNLPLDYKLDISLDWMENPTTTVREGYNASKKPANKNLKPIIGIEKKDSSMLAETAAVSKVETQAIKEQEKKEEEEKKEIAQPDKKEKSKKKKEPIETTVIRDKPQVISKTEVSAEETKSVDLLEMTRQKAVAEKKAREVEEEKEKAEMLAAQQKEEEMNREKAEEERIALAEKEAEQKKKAEEAAKVQKQQEELAKAAEVFAKRMKFVQDSTDKVKAQEAKKMEELKLQKAKEDSTIKAKQKNDSLLIAATLKQKLRDDSVARVKIQIAKEKAKQDSVAKAKATQTQIIPKPKQPSDSTLHTVQQPSKKSIPDSLPAKKTFYLPKTQEELIAAAEAFARQKKLVQDSVAKAKLLEQKKQPEKK